MRNSPKLVFAGGWSKIASANHTINVAPNLGAVITYYINPAGTMIFLLVGNNVEVRDYSVSHDVESIGGVIFTFPIPVGSDFTGISFSNNGLFMIITSAGNNRLYRYVLTIPFDLSTVTVPPPTEMSVAGVSNQRDCGFSTRGDFVFVLGTNLLVTYPLPINYDISSNITNWDNFFGNISGFAWKPEGNILYVIHNGSEKIDEFTINTLWDTRNKTFSDDFVFPVGVDPGQISIRSNGDEVVNLDLTSFILTKYHLDRSWEIETTSYHANDEPTLGTDPRAISWKPDGSKYFIIDFSAVTLTEFNTVSPFNQTNAVQGASFPLGSTQNRPTGMWWKPDGTRIYILGLTQDRINQLNVGTPWDVSTITDPVIQLQLVGLSFPSGIFFMPDGLDFYISDSGTPDMIHQYSLSIPWDITSTLTDVGFVDVTISALNPQDVFFRNNGETMLVISEGMNRVARYTLSTPKLITSAVFQDALDISNEETTARGLFMRQHDGKQTSIVGVSAQSMITYDVIT